MHSYIGSFSLKFSNSHFSTWVRFYQIRFLYLGLGFANSYSDIFWLWNKTHISWKLVGSLFLLFFFFSYSPPHEYLPNYIFQTKSKKIPWILRSLYLFGHFKHTVCCISHFVLNFHIIAFLVQCFIGEKKTVMKRNRFCWMMSEMPKWWCVGWT